MEGFIYTEYKNQSLTKYHSDIQFSVVIYFFFFFFSSRRRHTRCLSDWSSDVCSSDLGYFSIIGPYSLANFSLTLESKITQCGFPIVAAQKIKVVRLIFNSSFITSL